MKQPGALDTLVLLTAFSVRQRLTRALLLLLLLTSFPAFSGTQGYVDADQNLKQLSLEQLGNIEVTTVTKQPEEIWNTPAAIYVLTSEDIRRSGARSLPDILRLVPGVEVAQLDSSKFSVGIRGFGTRLSKSVLVLIDGRSVYTPLFAGVYWEMQQTLIEDIDRIEVIRGPGGTIWGPNAVNGVINIITKSSIDTHGVLVSAGGGNYEQGFLDFRYGGGKTDGFNYRIYGQGFNRAPEHHLDGQNFDDWREGQTGFRMDWKHGQKGSFTLQGDTYKEVVGNILGLSFYSPPSMIVQQGNIDLLGGNILGRYHHKFRDGNDLQVQVYWDRTHRADLNFEEIRNTFDFDLTHHITYTRNEFTWGVSARVSPDHFIQVIPTVDFEPHHQTYSIGTGFLQDELKIVPKKLSLTVGTKLEGNSYSGFDMQPSVRLLYTPGPHQSVWASVTRAVRTPSRIEENFSFTALAVPALPLYLRLIGDNHFVAEKMLGWELGYRASFTNRLFVDIASFYNQYNDLLSVENRPIVPETDPSPTHLILPIYLRNGLEGTTTGFEIAPIVQLTDHWRVKSSYSYLSLNVNRKSWSDDASSVQQTEGASPKHSVVVQSMYDLPKNFQLDLTYRYVGTLKFPHIDAYSTADARFGFHPNDHWDFSVIGENLLQPYHFEFSGDPGGLVGIKRSVFGKITFTR